MDTRKYGKYGLAGVIGAASAALITMGTGAFGATSSVRLAAGDSATVTCAGPSLSWTRNNATSGVASCAPNVTPPPPPPPGGQLQLDPSAPPLVVQNSTNNVDSITARTATFRPPANAVIVLGITINNYASLPYYETTVESVSNSGTPLVWTRQAASDWPASGVEGGSETWTASTGSTAPGPISITVEGSEYLTSTADDYILLTHVVIDSDHATPTVGNHAAGAGTGGLPSATMTMSPGSLGFAAVMDWAAQGGTSTFGPGLVGENNKQHTGTGNNPPDFSWHYFRSASGSAGGSTRFNMTAPTGQTWNETVVEVKGA